MPQVTRLRVVGAAIAAGALTLGSLATATAAQAANPRRAIAHTHPAWAVPAKRLSQAATAGTVNARVYLAPNNAAKLASDVAAVSTPGSSSYRHFMSASAVRTEFAPSAAEVASVKSWLTSAGLSVTSVSAKAPAGAYIGVRGSVAAASKAFGVTFGTYRGPDGAERPGAQPGGHRPLVRRQLGPRGLRPGHREEPDQAGAAEARPELLGRQAVLDLLRPEDRDQQAQGVRPVPALDELRLHAQPGPRGLRRDGLEMTGKGQTVAIVDAYASPTMHTDANQFAKATGDRQFAAGQYQQYQVQPYTLAGRTSATRKAGTARRASTSSPCTGWRPPPTSGMWPRAAAKTPTCWPPMARSWTNDLASIASNSWGEPMQYETLAYAFDYTFELGALEGIGFFFSSGDSGYEGPGRGPGFVRRPGGLPDVQPVRHLGGRNQPGHQQDEELPVGNLLGHHHRPADSHQERRQEVAVHSRQASTPLGTTAPAAVA